MIFFTERITFFLTETAIHSTIIQSEEKMTLKKEIIIVRVTYFVLVVGVCLVSWQLFKIKPKADKRIEQVVSEMVTRHNASAQWSECFENDSIKINGGHRPIFTIDVETALIANEPRPKLFYGIVVDVRKSDTEYCVVFRTGSDVDITFVLRCDTEQAEKILAQSEGPYAVIAAISHVQKSEYKFDDGRAHDVFVFNRFIANGVCLDFSFLGQKYNPWND